MNQKSFGYLGEAYAVDYLENIGYEIKDLNFSLWGGEIDIVSYDTESEEYVFVEVKTRSSEDYLHLDETLRSRQIETLKRTIRQYLYRRKIEGVGWRIDHIGIVISKGRVIKLEHIKAVNS